MRTIIFLFLLLFPLILLAQPNDDETLRRLGIQIPQTPQPWQPPNYSNFITTTPNPTNNLGVPSQPFGYVNPRVRAQQQALMNEVEMHQRRRTQQQAMLNEIYAEAEKAFAPKKKPDLSALPPLNHIPATRHYREAYTELQKMLTGKREMSLTEAVHLVENAFYGGTLPCDKLTNYVLDAAMIIQLAMKQAGFAPTDERAKKILLHQYMTGKIQLYDETGKVAYSTKPMQYDFDDPIGYKDHRKMFVSKLIDEGKGQCHSMPLLYLMIAEQLDIDAWLSTSPNHSFVKIQDDKGKWYNLELTNGHYVNNEFMMRSGYISGEAIRKGIYLDTLSKKELIARCMSDLAGGYSRKFGYDKFVLDASETALKYCPQDASAWSFKANYYGYWLMYVGNTLGYKSIEQVKKDFFANQILQQRDKIYQHIDRVGYNQMAIDEYKKWLQSFSPKHQVKYPVP